MLEKLLKEHNREWYEWTRYRTTSPYGDNLYYSIITEDGEVHSFFDRVCFAGIRYCEYYDSNYYDKDDDEPDDDPEDNDTSSYATVDAIIVEPYGCSLNPYDHRDQLPEYHRALRAWCELFSPFVLPREEDSSPMIVDMTTNADLDCVGAFLVGFRNMHEQGHYRMFNHLIDAGLPPHIAAYGSQLIRITGTLCDFANSSHNTISVSPHEMNVELIKKLKNTCKLYDQKKMIGKTKHRSQMLWTLSDNFYPSDKLVDMRDEPSFYAYLQPAVEMKKGSYGWNTFHSYPLDKVSPLFVELMK